MSDFNASREEIAKFIWSDKFSVWTPANKTLVIISNSEKGYSIPKDAMRHIMPESDMLALEDTPGGKILERLLKSNKLTSEDKVSLSEQARAKHIGHAEGNVTVLFTLDADTRNFERYHLPNIMRNQSITSVNHIEARAIKNEYEKGKGINPQEVVERITLVLQGKEDIPFLFKKSQAINPDRDRVMAIEVAIELTAGPSLRDVILKDAQNQEALERLGFKQEVLHRKEGLMSWRAKLPTNAIKLGIERYVLQKKYEKAEKSKIQTEKEINQHAMKLKSKEGIINISEKANELLKTKRNGIEIQQNSRELVIKKEVTNYIEARRVVAPKIDPYSATQWFKPKGRGR